MTTLETSAPWCAATRADDTVTRAVGRILRSDLVVVDLSRPAIIPKRFSGAGIMGNR